MTPVITIRGLFGHEACLEGVLQSLRQRIGHDPRSHTDIDLTLHAHRGRELARCTLAVRGPRGAWVVEGQGERMVDALEHAIGKMVACVSSKMVAA